MSVYRVQKVFSKKDSYGYSQVWDDEYNSKDYLSKNRKNSSRLDEDQIKIMDNIRKSGHSDDTGVKSTGIFNRDIEIRNDFDPIKNNRPVIHPGGPHEGRGRTKMVIANAHSEKAAYREYLDMVNKLGLKKDSGLLNNKQIKNELRKQAKIANLKKLGVISSAGVGVGSLVYGAKKLNDSHKHRKNHN